MEKLKNTNKIICENKGKCGGCFYTDVEYEDELKIKNAFVLETMKDFLGECDSETKVEIHKIIASPFVYGYKNKMEFSFGDNVKDGPLVLGMHENKSFYNICDASNCELVHEDICKVLYITQKYFREKEVSFYHKKSHLGYLRHLVIRRSFANGDLLINLVTTSQNIYKKDCSSSSNNNLGDEYSENNMLKEWMSLLLDNVKSISGICHTINDCESDTVKYENNNVKLLYGKDYIIEEINGLKFKITLPAFFQTNTLGAEKLYNKVKEFLLEENKLNNDLNIDVNDENSNANNEKVDILYDLYCGTATMSQIFSRNAKKVIGVEIIEEAVKMGEENCRLNHIDNVSLVCDDVMKYCVENARELCSKENTNTAIILDPPRAGVSSKALEVIVSMGAKKIVYVSCKCESLKRDAFYLVGTGYKLAKLCPVDMFPRTNNVETVALFIKGK